MIGELKTVDFSRGFFHLAAVGENDYRETLREAKRNSTLDEEGNGYIEVLIAGGSTDPDEFECYGIAIMTEQMDEIGWFDNHMNDEYCKALTLWEREDYLIRCKAKLRGGDEWPRISIGVWLDIARPQEIEDQYYELAGGSGGSTES